MTGPLDSVRVVEFAGIGPAPFAVMLLADLGADVIRIDRPSAPAADPSRPHPDVINRGRRSIALDLKSVDGLDIALRLVERSDILVEGYRPGVMERLGLGPTVCHGLAPHLVYARMTGWGQTGPLSQRAGHDIDYMAITGILDALGAPGEVPRPPVNFIGDLGGGALYCALGTVSALLHARVTGTGQVVDASVVDGTSSFANMVLSLRAIGAWPGAPGTNLLDGGAPFYRAYRCADGPAIAVGAVEPHFYAELLELSGVVIDGDDDPLAPTARLDPARWPDGHLRWEAVFAQRTRADWLAVFEGSDACVAAVLTLDEAASHPANTERGVYVRHDGVRQAAPAPRFDRTPSSIRRPAPHPGQHTDEILSELGQDPAAPMGVRILAATDTDAGELLTLQRAAYVSEAVRHAELGLPPLHQSLNDLRDELTTVTALKAMRSNRIVGSVRAQSEGEVWHITRLIVAPDEQGRGIGSALLTAVESRAPAHADRAALFTGHLSTENLRLYERAGYQEVRREHQSPAVELVHLEKSLR